jgi:hypothetical protein
MDWWINSIVTGELKASAFGGRLDLVDNPVLPIHPIVQYGFLTPNAKAIELRPPVD